MKLRDRIDVLEKEVQELKGLYNCSQGRHDLRFYDLGESDIPFNYYIRHVCKSCNKIFQRDLTKEEECFLKIQKLLVKR